jgi:enolase
MRQLDGTKGKKKLGANAILGVSMACARAGAASLVWTLSLSSNFQRKKRKSVK